MARATEADETIELLKTLIIVQLGLAGVTQKNIRAIVGGGIARVNEVVALISSGRKKPAKP